MTDLYWCEEPGRPGLPVVVGGDPHEALRQGKAVQFYEFDYRTAIERYSVDYPEADLWYTERNGDPITMLVPKGTPHDQLPSVAMDYIVFEWIRHDQLFRTGVGVRPKRSQP